MEKNSANKLFKILTAAVIILFGFVIVQSLLVKGSNSDMANMVLRAYDLLHGDILCRNWHEFMFYTTDLLFYDIVTLFTGISTKTVYIATFLMIILMYFAGALLIKRDGKFEPKFVLLFLLLTGINIDLYVHTAVFAYSFLALYFLNNYIWEGKKKDIILCSVFTLAGLIGDKLILPMFIMPVLVYCAVKLLKYPINDVKKYLNIIYIFSGIFLVFILLSKVLTAAGITIYQRNTYHLYIYHLFTLPGKFKIFLLQLIHLFEAQCFGEIVSIKTIPNITRFFVILTGYTIAFKETLSLLKDKSKDFINAILSLNILFLTFIMIFTNVNEYFPSLRYIAYFPAAFAVLITRKCFKLHTRPLYVLMTVLYTLTILNIIITPVKTSVFVDKKDTTAISEFLLSHNLTNGLATYWNASDIVVKTGNKLKIRAFDVYDNNVSQIFSSTNHKWYKDEKFNFILLTQKDIVKPEQLPEPDEIIHFENYIIYRYDNPIKVKTTR